MNIRSCINQPKNALLVLKSRAQPHSYPHRLWSIPRLLVTKGFLGSSISIDHSNWTEKVAGESHRGRSTEVWRPSIQREALVSWTWFPTATSLLSGKLYTHQNSSVSYILTGYWVCGRWKFYQKVCSGEVLKTKSCIFMFESFLSKDAAIGLRAVTTALGLHPRGQSPRYCCTALTGEVLTAG